MRKIRIAQIGINEYSHGRDIFNTLKSLSDEFEIVGYALVEDEREKFAHILSVFDSYRELSLDEILNDPTIDAVAVETEEIHLTKYARLAAEHGKHIHMEKPGGTELAEFESLIECVKAGGKTFHLGYMYRYNPAVIAWLEKIKKGVLGDVISVEATMDCRHPAKVREWLKTLDGGMTFFLGCHLLDLIMQIQGEPKRVLPLNKATGVDGAAGEDFGMAVLEYERGYSYLKTCALEYGGYMRRQFVVTGTKGAVELKPLEALTGEGYYTGIRYVGETNDWYADGERSRSELYGRYEKMMRLFADMVRGNYENPYTYDYEKALYRTLLRCCGKE